MTEPENNISPLCPRTPSNSRSAVPWWLVSAIKSGFTIAAAVGCLLLLLGVFLVRGMGTPQTSPGLHTTIHMEQVPGEALDGPGSVRWDNSEVRYGATDDPATDAKVAKADVEGVVELDNDSKKGSWSSQGASKVPAECDLFHGKWVKDASYPLYTNKTCKIISEHQNCQGNGRPDSGYEQYRWKPDDCELPKFNAKEFLESMKGKRILFVGDSLSRNHLESLVCLLDQEEEHVFKGNKHKLNYIYRKHNLHVSRVWSSWLVEEEVGNVLSIDKPNITLLHLDRIGESWLDDAVQSDLVILSTGHWFVKPTVYMLNGKPVGAQMLRNNDTSLSMSNVEAFQTGIKTVFTKLKNNPKFHGLLLFRSYTPDHYEGGKWDTGGSCSGKTEPKSSDYVWRNDFGEAMYKHQVQEFANAFATIPNMVESRRFVFMDIMPMATLRVDGHPGPYRGETSVETMRKSKGSKFPPPQDCLHWCLPGPVDTWNEFILPLARRALVT